MAGIALGKTHLHLNPLINREKEPLCAAEQHVASVENQPGQVVATTLKSPLRA